MNSSGIKRGLAGSAITALAISGLPFLATSAQADSYLDQLENNEVELYSQFSGFASVDDDGENETVHLLAGGGEGVDEVTFEYQVGDGEWQEIETVSRSNGGFSYEWTPPTNIYNLNNVTVRAVGVGSVGTPIEDEAATDEADVVVGSTTTAVDIAEAAGSSVGVFRQPYGTDVDDDDRETGAHNFDLGVISGTTSDVSNDPALEAYNLTTGEPTGSAAVNGTDFDEPANGVRGFRTSVDFTGYNYDTTAPVVNEAVVGVESGSDDAELVDLYTQRVGSVSAAPADASVPADGSTDGLVTVLDQNGEPVRGAQVIFDVDGDGVWDDEDGEYYTDVNGVATIEDLEPNAAGESYSVYVNTTDGDNYENNVDFRRSFTVGSFDQVVTDLTIESNDGDAFDADEYELGDLVVNVDDQNGTDLDGVNVNYSVVFTPEPTDDDVDNEDPITVTGSDETDEDGDAVIDLEDEFDDFDGQNGTYTVNAYVNQDGTPGQGAGDPSADEYEFTAGDSTLEFSDAEPASAGSTATFEATLELFDGTPLAGRDVRFTLDDDTTDLVMASQANQPAGTERIGNAAAEDTTDADGAVQVAVSDPANEEPRSELTAELNATTQNTEDLGDADEDAEPLAIAFVNDQGPEGTTVEITEDEGVYTPGEAVEGSLEVNEDDADTEGIDDAPVEDLLVTLTVDGDAFFTDSDEQDDVDTDDGDLEGDNLVNLGQTITVVTGPEGTADYEIAIQGSDDFDDDGEATVNVTATASGDTDTEDYDFSTDNPLNGGDVVVELASAGFQDSGVLPNLPVSDDAAYDVMVTDQFGNPVGGEPVTVDIDGVGTVVAAGDLKTDFNDNTEFKISSDVAGDSTPVVTWETDSNVYDDGDVVSEEDDEVEGEGPTVSFYEVDFANSTFELSQRGPDTVPVGTTVIMDYTATDQNGEPIEFFVDFFRTGPDEFGDGESNDGNATGEDGKASYVFQGASEGTATVTAIGYDKGANDATREVIPESQTTDTVTFGDVKPPEKVIVEAIISADSNGPKKDVVRFQVDDEAEGATVKLFKIRGKKSKGNKRLVQVREDIVPEGGTLTFKVADRNGNQKTRFIAKVSETDISEKAKSNTQKPR